MSVYLDYNASTPIDERVLDAMIKVYKNHIGNADSRTHSYGSDAGKIVDDARSQVANLFGVKKGEVFFTSGATESNNIAIQGLKNYGIANNKRHIITTAIEHKAVLETAKKMKAEGFRVDFVMPDASGRVDSEAIKALVSDDTLLVSVMHVNNETGIIQPVLELGEFLAEKKVLFHVDATQSSGKLVDELRALQYDMLSFSAHKFGGPQGIGGLILRKKRYKLPPVEPIFFGGQQEGGIRPGTVPVALIVGAGVACELAAQEYKKNADEAKAIKTSLLRLLDESGLAYRIHGDQDYCVSTTLNFSILGVSAEALMLVTNQYCSISNGSACTSQNYSLSYVLKAMNLIEDEIDSALRISWGHGVNKNNLEKNFNEFLNIAKTFQ